jgi:hypothetical protein
MWSSERWNASLIKPSGTSSEEAEEAIEAVVDE